MPGITEIVQISSQLPLISSQHPSHPGSREINKRGKKYVREGECSRARILPDWGKKVDGGLFVTNRK